MWIATEGTWTPGAIMLGRLPEDIDGGSAEVVVNRLATG